VAPPGCSRPACRELEQCRNTSAMFRLSSVLKGVAEVRESVRRRRSLGWRASSGGLWTMGGGVRCPTRGAFHGWFGVRALPGDWAANNYVIAPGDGGSQPFTVVRPGTRPRPMNRDRQQRQQARSLPHSVYETLPPPASVRRTSRMLPERANLNTLITFFNSRAIRLEAPANLGQCRCDRRQGANRILAEHPLLSYLRAPLTHALVSQVTATAPWLQTRLRTATSVPHLRRAYGGLRFARAAS